MNVDKGLKIKVLVLGDSGVGKSSLAHLLCYEEENKSPGYTIGCSIHVKLHDYKAGTPDEKTYCVEMWDIGASKSHRNSRFIFYSGVNGVILVHDLSNKKTLQNLHKWLNEVLNKELNAGLSSVAVGGGSIAVMRHLSDDEENNVLPLLVVGTKIDATSESKRDEIMRRSAMIADEFNCTEMQMNCHDTRFIAAGSGNAVKLSRFLDKVVSNAIQKRMMPRSELTPNKYEKNIATDSRRRIYNQHPITRLSKMD